MGGADMRLGFKAALLQRGISQSQLGRLANIHDSRLSRIGNGWIDPTPDERKTLAAILKRSEHELFDTNSSIEIRSARQ